MERTDILKELLMDLSEAKATLEHSYKICSKINTSKESFDIEEKDDFEALNSRFARTSDIVIQKVFRSLDELDLENSGSIRDRINRAEKKGLIDSASTFIEIREFRNMIAHEYSSKNLKNIYKSTLKYTPEILKAINKIEAYCNEKYPSL